VFDSGALDSAETGLDRPGPIAEPAPQDVLVTRPVSTKENLDD